MTATVHVLTLHRPWGYAITRLDKRVENRDWFPRLVTPFYLAIREGNTWSGEFEGAPERGSWLGGMVVGIAQVIGFWRPGEGDATRWRNMDCWGWRLSRVAACEPVCWPPTKEERKKRCMQGLVELQPAKWESDQKLLEALRAAWRTAA